MKKLVLLFVALTMCLGISAQKIKVNEVDKFTKKKVIETSFEKIVNDNNPLGSTGGRMMKNVWAGFKKVDESCFLRIKWCTNQIVGISEGAEIMLLDSEGNSYTFKNLSLAVSETGAGTVGFAGSAIPGVDLYIIGDYTAIVGKSITSMRIYTNDGYVDFNLNKSAYLVISDAYSLVKDL